MRYEHILQIYWTKGFFFSGNLFYFDKTLRDLQSLFSGLGRSFFKKITERFELGMLFSFKKQMLINYQTTSHKVILQPLNIILSQVNSVNNQINELKRLNIIRLFLIKSYRGRCHALGKPVRGQRTWSNAWNSFNINKTLRVYISETNFQIKSKERVEKINYKVLKKKYTQKKKKKVLTKKKLLWF